MSDVVITPVEHALGSGCTGAGSNHGDAMFSMCPGRMEFLRQNFARGKFRHFS